MPSGVAQSEILFTIHEDGTVIRGFMPSGVAQMELLKQRLLEEMVIRGFMPSGVAQTYESQGLRERLKAKELI